MVNSTSPALTTWLSCTATDDDAARDIGRERDLGLLHIGIVGIDESGRRRARNRRHRRTAAPAGRASARSRSGLRFFLAGASAAGASAPGKATTVVSPGLGFSIRAFILRIFLD